MSLLSTNNNPPQFMKLEIGVLNQATQYLPLANAVALSTLRVPTTKLSPWHPPHFWNKVIRPVLKTQGLAGLVTHTMNPALSARSGSEMISTVNEFASTFDETVSLLQELKDPKYDPVKREFLHCMALSGNREFFRKALAGNERLVDYNILRNAASVEDPEIFRMAILGNEHLIGQQFLLDSVIKSDLKLVIKALQGREHLLADFVLREVGFGCSIKNEDPELVEKIFFIYLQRKNQCIDSRILSSAAESKIPKLCEKLAFMAIQQNYEGKPICCAALSGNFELFKQVTDGMEDFSVGTLSAAARSGNIDIFLRVFLGREHLMNTSDANEVEAVINSAARSRNPKIFNMVIQGRENQMKRLALLLALESGNLEILDRAIRARPDLVDPDVLTGALNSGNPEILDLVIQARPNLVDPRVLLAVLRSGNLKLFGLVIHGRGAFIDRNLIIAAIKLGIKHRTYAFLELMSLENENLAAQYELITTAMSGKIEEFRKAINGKKNNPSFFRLALIAAARSGNLAISTEILNAERGLIDEEVLLAAAESGNCELFQFLVSGNESLLTKRILDAAAKSGNAKLFKILFDLMKKLVSNETRAIAFRSGNPDLFRIACHGNWSNEAALQAFVYGKNLKMVNRIAKFARESNSDILSIL